jgi:hypothetical protein
MSMMGVDMNHKVRLVCILGLLVGSSTCALADIRWDLTNVKFSNGDIATGFFTTNTALNAINSFNIVVSGPALAYDFTAVKAAGSYLPTHVGFGDQPFTSYIDLVFASPMTSSGATVALASGLLCAPSAHCASLNSGATLVDPPAAVPEPASILLLSTVVAFWGIKLRRRRHGIPNDGPSSALASP